MTPETLLSEREREILRLVATGATNNQIAAQLDISANTVKVHLRNIFGKIGVASRTEASVFAMRTGLIDGPPAAQQTAPPPDLPVPAAQPAAPPLDPPVLAAQPAAPPLDLPRRDPRPHDAPVRRSPQLLAILALLVLGALGGALAWQTVARPATPTPEAGTVLLPSVKQRWRPLPPLPAGRAAFALAAANEQLYVIGGTIGGKVSASVLGYDTLAPGWRTLRDKPTAVADIQAARVGDKIFVPGGRRADGQISDRLEVYDPATDTWEARASLPAARSGYALLAVEGKLYLFGGTDSSAPQDQVWRYDPDGDVWNVLSPMPAARAFAGAAVEDEQIYLFGGVDTDGPLTSVLRYNAAAEGQPGGPWSALAALPAPGIYLAGAAANGLVFAIGGGGTVYNITIDQWQPLRTPLDASLTDARVITLNGREVYIIGGRNTGGEVRDTYEYQAIFSVFLPASEGE